MQTDVDDPDQEILQNVRYSVYAQQLKKIQQETRKCGPHCDSDVLHAPGECKYCDKFADSLQSMRITLGINFTGHNDPNKLTCPAELRRSKQKIDRWHGNGAVPEGKQHTMDFYYPELHQEGCTCSRCVWSIDGTF